MMNMMNTEVCSMLYVFVLFFKMAQGVEEHRTAIIALPRIGMKSGEIFKTFQGLSVSCMFVYQTLALYRESGSPKGRPGSDRPRVIFIHKNESVQCVNTFEETRYTCKQKVMNRDMKISEDHESYCQR